jgi:hypothetical protein
MKLGDRVFAGGTLGKNGVLRAIVRSPFGYSYFVEMPVYKSRYESCIVSGSGGLRMSGPFTDVRPA